MPLRARKPRRIIPTTLSDAIDGSQAPAGAMAQLANLIRQPNAEGVFVPRPAVQQQAVIPNEIGQATALLTSGLDFYGMAPSSAFPGQDAPFFYESDTNTFVTISGLAAGLLPTSQPTTGKWTPPTIAPVAGRAIFTHPGFAGGATLPPLWLELLVNTTINSPIVNAPYAAGTMNLVGSVIYGSGIPVGTTVTASTLTTAATTASGNASSNSIVVASAAGIQIGQLCSLNAFVIGVSGTTITLGSNLAQTIISAPVTFQGFALTLSANATASQFGIVVDFVSTIAVKFGWLDFSEFTASIVGNTIAGVPVITGAPLLTGVQPGQTVAGANIPAAAVVQQATNVNFTIGVFLTSGSPTVVLVSQTFGIGVGGLTYGQTISGVGIPPGTAILSVSLATSSITLSQAATAAGAANLTVSGGIIVLSLAPTATQTQIGITVSGGTPTAPLWGAGDLNINPIAGTAPPIFVEAFNGRADYGVDLGQLGQSIQCSDAGSPCTQTFVSQTLTLNTRAPLTAASAGDLSTLLGGVVSGLFIFQGDEAITQITGDFSTNNVSTQVLPVAASTFAPNSIANTPRGLLFIASDGLRMITQSGAVTDPIGADGAGMSLPFLNALVPSRIAAAFNENIYRVTVQWLPPPTVASVWGKAVRTDEFWFHLSPLGQPLERSRWSGPHSATAALIQPFPLLSSFLTAPLANPGSLYRSDVIPLANSGYTEAGKFIACAMKTLLMPDNPEAYAVEIIETTVWAGFTAGQDTILATATDDVGETLAQAYVWTGPFSGPAQFSIPWPNKLIFRQASLSFSAQANPTLQIGPIAIRENVLGYQLPYPIPVIAVLNESILGGGDVAA